MCVTKSSKIVRLLFLAFVICGCFLTACGSATTPTQPPEAPRPTAIAPTPTPRVNPLDYPCDQTIPLHESECWLAEDQYPDEQKWPGIQIVLTEEQWGFGRWVTTSGTVAYFDMNPNEGCALDRGAAVWICGSVNVRDYEKVFMAREDVCKNKKVVLEDDHIVLEKYGAGFTVTKYIVK